MITKENRVILGREWVAKPGIQAAGATEDAGCFLLLWVFFVVFFFKFLWDERIKLLRNCRDYRICGSFCRTKLIKPGVWARFEVEELPFPYQMFEFFRPSVDTWHLAPFAGKRWHRQQSWNSHSSTVPSCLAIEDKDVRVPSWFLLVT